MKSRRRSSIAGKTRARPRQYEWAEQVRVVHWLTRARVEFCAVPNGGYALSVQAGMRMKAAGLRAGFPDLLIFDAPPNRPDCVGVAVEMKRADGGRVTEEQERWHVALAARGWAVKVCAGAAEALAWLASLGYRVPGTAA